MDFVKWIIVIVFLFFDILVFYCYSRYSVYLSVFVFFLFTFISICMALTTRLGKSFLLFARESRAEIGKVIWPTGREALYTTLIVMLVTLVTSILLWGLDNLLVRFVSLVLRL